MKKNQFRYFFLLLCFSIFFMACNRAGVAQKATSEAISFGILSFIGTGVLGAVIMVPYFFVNLTSDLTKLRLLLKIIIVLPFIVLAYWTFVLLTDWVGSTAYQYGKGTEVIIGFYLLAVASYISIVFQTKRKITILENRSVL